MDLDRLALVPAAPFAALGVLEVLHRQPAQFAAPIDYLIEVVFVVAATAAAVTLAALSARAVAGVRAAWAAASGGSAALATSAVATAVVGHDALGPLFLLGLLGLVVGYVGAAVLDLRGRVQPSRAGVVLLGSFIASIALETTGAGGLVLAAGWFAVGALARERKALLPA